jgi:hypothetical protein
MRRMRPGRRRALRRRHWPSSLPSWREFPAWPGPQRIGAQPDGAAADSWQEFSRTPIANLAGNPKLAGNPIANHMRSMPPEIGAILRSAAGRMIVTVNKRLSYRTRRLMKGLTGTRRLIRPDLRAYLTAPQPFFLALYFSLD